MLETCCQSSFNLHVMKTAYFFWKSEGILMNKFHGDIKQRDTSEMFCRIYEPTCWTPHLRVTRCGRETSVSTQFPGSSFFLPRKSTLLSRGRKRGPWELDCITLINGEKVCALVTVKGSVLNVQLKIPPLSRQLSNPAAYACHPKIQL